MKKAGHKKLGPWLQKSKKLVYQNPWIEVHHHEVMTPANTEGVYGTVSFKNLAVGVLPLDDQGNTWLVGQYRYPLETYSWEIPEGGSPSGEDPLQAARRELKEETGLVPGSLELLLEMDLSNSVTDEQAVIYLATRLEQQEPEPEETEELKVKKVPVAEALSMVHAGEITDAISVAALLKLATHPEYQVFLSGVS
jgi:8-oxo-dGTP pyrophosphatase MutT (NUDIX family)